HGDRGQDSRRGRRAVTGCAAQPRRAGGRSVIAFARRSGVVTGAGKSSPRSLEARAIGLLARREYSRAELRERLVATGAERDEVDALLETLAGQGYLSDERYARGVVDKKSG